MTRPKSISDEQLFKLIREAQPRDESFPAAAAESEGDRVLSDILTRYRSEVGQPRRSRAGGRGKIARTGAVSVGAVLVLSGSALAAGNALGVIELGGAGTAETVTRVPTMYPSKDGKSYQIDAKPGTAYAYKLAGGQSPLHCTDPELLVESDRQLSKEELHTILLEESVGPTHVASDLLPPGVKSIGWACIPAHPVSGSSNAQAEAEAEGWTAEKFREHLHATIQKPTAGSNAAQANAAMAEAEAEGFTPEKFREDLHAKTQP